MERTSSRNVIVAAIAARSAALAWRGARAREQPLLARGGRRARGGAGRSRSCVVARLSSVVALLDSVAWIGGAQRGRRRRCDKPRTHHRPHLPARTSRRRSYSAPLADGRVLRRRSRSRTRAATCSAPTSSAATCCYRTLKGARVALLIGGLTSLIVDPARAAVRRLGRLLRRPHRRRRLLPDLDARLDAGAAAADRAHHGARARARVQVCVALGVTGWVRLLPHRARRDAQAARARLRGGGARARRLRARASSCATSCPTSPTSSSSPSC